MTEEMNRRLNSWAAAIAVVGTLLTLLVVELVCG